MLDSLTKPGAGHLDIAEPMVRQAQIDEGVAQENLGLHLARGLEALFKMWDCVGVPVVQQQRTTQIQRSERDAPFIVEFAERISGACEQVFASARIPNGIDHAKGNRSRCRVLDITKLGVEVDCRLQSGSGSFVVALPKGKHPEPKARVCTFASAQRCLIDEHLLHDFYALAEKPGDPQERPDGYRHAGDATSLSHIERPAHDSADVWQVGTVLLDHWTRITPEHRLGRENDALVVVGVRPPESFGLSQGFQLFECKVTDDLQHGEAWLSMQRVFGTKEAFVHQRGD